MSAPRFTVGSRHGADGRYSVLEDAATDGVVFRPMAFAHFQDDAERIAAALNAAEGTAAKLAQAEDVAKLRATIHEQAGQLNAYAARVVAVHRRAFTLEEAARSLLARVRIEEETFSLSACAVDDSIEAKTLRRLLDGGVL